MLLSVSFPFLADLLELQLPQQASQSISRMHQGSGGTQHFAALPDDEYSAIHRITTLLQQAGSGSNRQAGRLNTIT